MPLVATAHSFAPGHRIRRRGLGLVVAPGLALAAARHGHPPPGAVRRAAAAVGPGSARTRSCARTARPCRIGPRRSGQSRRAQRAPRGARSGERHDRGTSASTTAVTDLADGAWRAPAASTGSRSPKAIRTPRSSSANAPRRAGAATGAGGRDVRHDDVPTPRRSLCNRRHHRAARRGKGRGPRRTTAPTDAVMPPPAEHRACAAAPCSPAPSPSRPRGAGVTAALRRCASPL